MLPFEQRTREVWKRHDAAVVTFLETKPGTEAFSTALAAVNATEFEVARLDAVRSGALEEFEISAALVGVAAALRGRIRDDLVVRVVAVVEAALLAPASVPTTRCAPRPRKAA